jgi:hypothetical protein
MKLKNHIGIIGAITGVAGLVVAVVLGVINYNLAMESHNLQMESLRADVNIFIEPIEKQNWTFTSNGVFLEVKGLLVNEGSRTTEMGKAELYLTFPFPEEGGEHVFTIPSNVTKDFMEDYTIEEGGQRGFTISYFIMNHLVVNKETGEIMQIGDVKPLKVGVTMWYNDNIGEKSSYGETY